MITEKNVDDPGGRGIGMLCSIYLNEGLEKSGDRLYIDLEEVVRIKEGLKRPHTPLSDKGNVEELKDLIVYIVGIIYLYDWIRSLGKKKMIQRIWKG